MLPYKFLVKIIPYFIIANSIYGSDILEKSKETLNWSLIPTISRSKQNSTSITDTTKLYSSKYRIVPKVKSKYREYIDSNFTDDYQEISATSSRIKKYPFLVQSRTTSDDTNAKQNAYAYNSLIYNSNSQINTSDSHVENLPEKNKHLYFSSSKTPTSIGSTTLAIPYDMSNGRYLEDDGKYEDESRKAKNNKKIKIKRKHYKKFLLPLLLAYKLKFFTLVPLLLGGLVLLAGSTGLAGFFFALFAAVMGLRMGAHGEHS